MGVELRVHTFFLLLAAVCVGLGASENVPGGKMRGLVLFAILAIAVVVRETARLIVAAWMGLRLRAILLLPIGGFFAYANPESQERATNGGGQYALAAAGPLANALTALALTGLFLGAAPEYRHPGISAGFGGAFATSDDLDDGGISCAASVAGVSAGLRKTAADKFRSKVWRGISKPGSGGSGTTTGAGRNDWRNAAAQPVADYCGIFHHDWRAG